MSPAPRTSRPPRLTRRASLGLAALLLSGCGFALRQPPRFAFRTLYLVLPSGSSLRPSLTRALQFNPDVRVIPEAGDMNSADAILEIASEVQEKVVAGLNAAGQVKEFLLRVRLRFRLRTPQGRELIPLTELLVERDIGFAEGAALAKAEEEVLLYRDMRQDLQQQLLRRLAAVRDLNGPPQPPSR